jgi:hypothetical protein
MERIEGSVSITCVMVSLNIETLLKPLPPKAQKPRGGKKPRR